MKLTGKLAKEILGKYDTLGGGHFAQGDTGSVLLDAPPLPADAMALPRTWRNVFSRCLWFASQDTRKGAMSCIELGGKSAIAGSRDAAICIPFACGGLPLPFLLPVEINWSRIPGEDDAFVWWDNGSAVLQTASGIRVTAARGTQELEPFAWSRVLENEDPTYTLVSIVEPDQWVDAFSVAPTVVSLMLEEDAVLVREVQPGDAHGWLPAWLELPIQTFEGIGPEGVHVPGEVMHRALLAVGTPIALGLKGPRDSVFVAGADDEWVAVLPVRQAEPGPPSSGKLAIAPVEPPTSKRPRGSTAPPPAIVDILRASGIR